MDPVHTLASNIQPFGVVAIVLGAIIAIPVGVLLVIYLIIPMFKGIAWLFKQVGVFIFSTLADLLRLVGTLITSLVLVPLTVGNVVIGRWSASAHYGRAIQSEFKNAGRCVYRLAIGNPARLLCLTPLTEGLERRIPEVMAAAPGPDRPKGRQGQFGGYEIVGSLAGGGSGGRLYVAKPDAQKLAAFARNGHADVDRVVIKCFAMSEGTTLPQIVRENRALDAAKKLGLILEHDITDERFYYVMRYVPGDSLNLVTQRLHAGTGGSGLGRRELQEILSYGSDLLRTLRAYHDGGLWHKDVKPDNVIVCGGRAHLVDFGLVTPLRSSMTLTTHGTEYFRDPEMVRMALKGVKVHEVDGARFDIYAVGAVIFSMVENSFPAHGGLSQISRPCPETVRWIVRRAMTDYDKRYASAAAMLADVDAVLRAADPFALRPAHLPSMAGVGEREEGAPAFSVPPPMSPPIPQQAPVFAAMPVMGPAVAPPTPAAAGAPGRPDGWAHYPGMNPNVGAGVGAAAHSPIPPAAGGRVKPDIRVTAWFSGRYNVGNTATRTRPASGVASAFGPANAAMNAAAQAMGAAAQAMGSPERRSPRVIGLRIGSRAPAGEQLRRAKERAAAARDRIRSRTGRSAQNFPAGINFGVAAAVFVFLAILGVALLSMYRLRSDSRNMGATLAPDLSAAPPVSDLYVVADAVGPMPVMEKAKSRSGRSAVKPALSNVTVPSDWRVLVVCEWSKFDDERRDLIAHQIANLGDAGFLLVGDFVPAVRTSASEGDRHAETVAQLRSAVGTRPYLSADARNSIREWMDDEQSAEMVLWFNGMEPGQPGKPAAAWLVGSTDAAPELVAKAQGLLKAVH